MDKQPLNPYIIDEEALINIQVNALVLNVIREILMQLIDKMGQEKFIRFTKEIMEENKTPQNEEELHVYILSTFLGLCEQEAMNQKAVRTLSEEEMKKWDESKNMFKHHVPGSNES